MLFSSFFSFFLEPIRTIKTSKTTNKEHLIIILLGNLVGPTPSTGESAVNTRASIIKVVGTRTIKSMFKEIVKNLNNHLVHATKLGCDPVMDKGVLAHLDNVGNNKVNGRQNAGYLGILVKEKKRVRHRAITKVHYRRADPLMAGAVHGTLDDDLHGAVYIRAGLDAVKALTRVAKVVAVAVRCKIRIGVEPEREHVTHYM